MEVLSPPIETEELAIVSDCREHGLQVTETSLGNTWPFTNNAIMEFDTGTIKHVESWADRTVKDENGNAQRGDYYGTVKAWASYDPNPVTKPKEATERLYIALQDETTYSVAHKLRHHGFTEQEFIEHNGITPGSLNPGQVYHLPMVGKVMKDPEPFYEAYETPKLFHISKEGGTYKWAFGSARKLKDIIHGSGHYPQNREINVAAVAYVPIEGETFLYCLDALALGDFIRTGRVKYAIGFAYKDLTAGPAPEVVVADPSPQLVKQIEETIASIEPELPVEVPIPNISVPAPSLPDDVLSRPDSWRLVRWYKEPRTLMIDLKDGEKEILIHDLARKAKSVRVFDDGDYIIAGEFSKDGVDYALPNQCVIREEDGTRIVKRYYGIPCAVLIDEQELYNVVPDLSDKLAMNSTHLTPAERFIIPTFALTRLSYDRLKLYGQKLKNKYRR